MHTYIPGKNNCWSSHLMAPFFTSQIISLEWLEEFPVYQYILIILSLMPCKFYLNFTFLIGNCDDYKDTLLEQMSQETKCKDNYIAKVTIKYI